MVRRRDMKDFNARDYVLSLTDEELGYYDYSHFYKALVIETGKSPSGIP